MDTLVETEGWPEGWSLEFSPFERNKGRGVEIVRYKGIPVGTIHPWMNEHGFYEIESVIPIVSGDAARKVFNACHCYFVFRQGQLEREAEALIAGHDAGAAEAALADAPDPYEAA